MGAVMRIVFVCTGNICRSPYAEYLARELSGSTDIEFASAG
ncbi:MAG: low molecular weight protein arginine phosphatase, partial [Acidimicrobiia bacterium]